jgi:transposase InsO family protein
VVYFAFVIDVFSRRVVGWQLASHMRTTPVLDALRMALGTREPGADFRLVAHSDRGSQYTSAEYTQVLEDHRVLASGLPPVSWCAVSRVLGRGGGFGCPAGTRRRFGVR